MGQVLSGSRTWSKTIIHRMGRWDPSGPASRADRHGGRTRCRPQGPPQSVRPGAAGGGHLPGGGEDGGGEALDDLPGRGRDHGVRARACKTQPASWSQGTRDAASAWRWADARRWPFFCGRGSVCRHRHPRRDHGRRKPTEGRGGAGPRLEEPGARPHRRRIGAMAAHGHDEGGEPARLGEGAPCRRATDGLVLDEGLGASPERSSQGRVLPRAASLPTRHAFLGDAGPRMHPCPLLASWWAWTARAVLQTCDCVPYRMRPCPRKAAAVSTRGEGIWEWAACHRDQAGVRRVGADPQTSQRLRMPSSTIVAASSAQLLQSASFFCA